MAHQCQIKWHALRRGYDNVCKILSENRKGFLIQNPNLFDIEFFEMMSDEFWLLRSNKSINLT